MSGLGYEYQKWDHEIMSFLVVSSDLRKTKNSIFFGTSPEGVRLVHLTEKVGLNTKMQLWKSLQLHDSLCGYAAHLPPHKCVVMSAFVNRPTFAVRIYASFTT
jgi:hypothetical protein